MMLLHHLKINNLWKARFNKEEKVKVDKIISIIENTINGGGGRDGGESTDD